MTFRLTELGLTRRLRWQEVADIAADHEADLASAVDLALVDRERFSVDQAQARHISAVYALLSPRRVA